MTDVDRDPTPDPIRIEILARGWGRFLRLVERIRRVDAGEPAVRIVRDDGTGS